MPAPVALIDNRYRVATDLPWTPQLAPESASLGPYLVSGGGHELSVRVLNGEGINGHRWVWWSTWTHLSFTLWVEDTATGCVKVYSHKGEQAVPHRDFWAFSPDGCGASPTKERHRSDAALLQAWRARPDGP